MFGGVESIFIYQFFSGFMYEKRECGHGLKERTAGSTDIASLKNAVRDKNGMV